MHPILLKGTGALLSGITLLFASSLFSLRKEAMYMFIILGQDFWFGSRRRNLGPQYLPTYLPINLPEWSSV